MSQPFLAQIALFPYNFAPRGWALCHGQLMSISQNPALFALLGTMYGGDGKVTFGLPDLQGRVPISRGQGPGLSSYVQGEQLGLEPVTLLAAENGIHQQSLNATTNQGNTATAANNQMASAQSGSVHTGFTNA